MLQLAVLYLVGPALRVKPPAISLHSGCTGSIIELALLGYYLWGWHLERVPVDRPKLSGTTEINTRHPRPAELLRAVNTDKLLLQASRAR